ncbi:MAG: glucosaminidase domain-containing protein [Chloroflexota bacterium]
MPKSAVSYGITTIALALTLTATAHGVLPVQQASMTGTPAITQTVPTADPTATQPATPAPTQTTASPAPAPTQPAANPAPPAQDNLAAQQPAPANNAPAGADLSTRSDRPATAATPASEQERFIAGVADAAKASQQQTGVPASVTIAQAMLESNLGKSKLASDANNYFGIKANSGTAGSAGVYNAPTLEHLNGRDVQVTAAFKAYNSITDSFTDHGLYLSSTPRYAEAMKHTDNPQQFAKLIQKAGYATDPAYASKLIKIMDTYNLYQYDH